VAVALLLVAALAHAEPKGAPSATDVPRDAGADATPPPPAHPPTPQKNHKATALEVLAGRVRALLAGTLDTSIDAATLFEQQLDDEKAIRVEVERLRAIVEDAGTAEGADGGAAHQPPGKKKPAKQPPRKQAKPVTAKQRPLGGDAGVPTSLQTLDPELWRAQLAVDRARLAFYELPKSRREALLAQHATRQREDRAAGKERELTKVEDKAVLPI
jgi:hypothetical protein